MTEGHEESAKPGRKTRPSKKSEEQKFDDPQPKHKDKDPKPPPWENPPEDPLPSP